MAKKDFYSYAPSVPAAIIFAVLYCIDFVLMICQIIRYRSWVWTVMLVACLCKNVPLSLYVERWSFANLDRKQTVEAGFHVCRVSTITKRSDADGKTVTRFITLIFVGCDISESFRYVLEALPRYINWQVLHTGIYSSSMGCHYDRLFRYDRAGKGP